MPVQGGFSLIAASGLKEYPAEKEGHLAVFRIEFEQAAHFGFSFDKFAPLKGTDGTFPQFETDILLNQEHRIAVLAVIMKKYDSGGSETGDEEQEKKDVELSGHIFSGW